MGLRKAPGPKTEVLQTLVTAPCPHGYRDQLPKTVFIWPHAPYPGQYLHVHHWEEAPAYLPAPTNMSWSCDPSQGTGSQVPTALDGVEGAQLGRGEGL
jgi:hypothetical protein